MLTRAEKLFNIRAQVNKGVAMLEHGDHDTAIRELAGAMTAVILFLDKETPVQASVYTPIPVGADEGDHPRIEKPESTRIKVTKK